MISLLGEAAVSTMGSVGVHRSMISWSVSDNDAVAVVVACRVGGVGVIGIVPKEIIFTGVIGIVPVDTIVGSIEFKRMTRGCRSTMVSIIR
jgi:hypothetical protein